MMAKALALNGAAKVYILGRRLEKLQEAAKQSPHGNMVPIVCDVTSKDSLQAAVSKVSTESGHINLLICNSGILGPRASSLPQDPTLQQFQETAWSWSADDFNATYALNNTAVFFTAIAFLHLLAAGNEAAAKATVPGEPSTDSQILITASIASYIKLVVSGFAYTSSKAGAASMAKSFSTMLAPYSIRCNAIAPGLFPSDMTGGAVTAFGGSAEGGPESSARGAKVVPKTNIPQQRMGTEQEMAGTVLYLASRAGAYMNGSVVTVDGGRLSVVPSGI